MKRVLVFGMTENPGGVENFLLNYYRNIDRKRVQFDFLCNSYETVAYEDELVRLGGRIFHVPPRSKNIVRFYQEMNRIFQTYASEWAAVWVNVSSLANIDYLKYAKRYGITRRIIHSHNSQNMDNYLRGMLHAMNKKILGHYATDYWACSTEAARWFFKDSMFQNAVIVRNAIDVSRYAFSLEKREALRRELGISTDTFVIGNIGRLHFQKNQAFAIKVFREYQKINSNSCIIFVGQGNDESFLKQESSDLKTKVIFAGIQNDIQAWLSAFDFFLFPSKFEGLGIAALEAQANGLPVLAADMVIPKEAKVTDSLEFFGLQQSPLEWAKRIYNSTTRRCDSESIYKAFRESGYDIGVEAKKLERLFYD